MCHHVIQMQNGNGYKAVSSQDEDEEGKTSEPQEKAQEESKTNQDQKLSICQIIIRRGLTAFTVILILCVGVTVHFTVPLPEVAFLANNTQLESFNSTVIPQTLFDDA